jgi:hypothetical protein
LAVDRGGTRRQIGGRRPNWESALIFVLGLAVTIALTVNSSISYSNNQRRLTVLQTRLSASILQAAQPDLQAILGRIAGLVAESPDPAATFEKATAEVLAPAGPFVNGTIALVRSGQVQVLDHVGAPVVRALDSPATIALFQEASRSSTLVTSRVVGDGVQRLGYLLSVPGTGGVYVVSMAQQLPVDYRVSTLPGSPSTNMDFALYWGATTDPSSLVETNASHLPLHGTVATVRVPIGNNQVTMVAAARGSLVGAWPEALPWLILGVGLTLAATAAAVTEIQIRRRHDADALYRQQRQMSETLQRALLPRRFPLVEGWEFDGLYVPATLGAEIGGDWYSVVEIDDHSFGFVLGDVSGHDMAAAGVMAGLRHTIRTLMRTRLGPDEVLVQAGTDLEQISDDHFATALVGVVDTSKGIMRLASAGHPPPLLLVGGRAEAVTIEPGPPLGVPGPAPTVTEVPVPAGCTVIAFTDGLVEKRGQGLDCGLADLARAAATGPGPLDELLSHLLGSLTAGDHEDDIAVLAVRCL